MQGDIEARTKLYLSTAKEYWRYRRSNAPKDANASSCAAWQSDDADRGRQLLVKSMHKKVLKGTVVDA